MSVLDRKLGRDLAAARLTIVAILLVIVVGIASFVGMASVYVNLEAARRDYYAASRMADFWIDLKRAPRTDVERLVDLPGVAEVQARIAFQAMIDLPDVERPINGQIISLPDTPGSTINGIVLRRGTYFSDDRLEEVILNDAFARARNVRPGETIHAIVNNRRQPLHVVGTALGSEFVYLVNPGGILPDPESYGLLYVKESFAEEAMDFDGACNQVVGLLTPDLRERPRRVLEEMERRLEPAGVFSAIPRARQLSHQILTDEIVQLRASAVILPVIFLAVAAVVLNILMSRLAEQQRTTVGTLKALGYTDGELLRHYVKFGALIGLLGGVLGVIVGHWFMVGMTVMYRIYFEFPRLDPRPVAWVYAVGIALGLVFAVLGTMRGVRAVVRLDPAEAMRAKPPDTGGAVPLERFRRLWRRLGFRWQMVVRSIARHKWRVAAGAFAAAMGAALLFTTFYFMASMNYLMEHQFEKVLLSDIDLVFKDVLDEDAVREVRRLPGVLRAEPQLFVACDLRRGSRTKRTAITGVAPDARLTAARTADGSRVPIPEAGVLLSRRIAEILDVRAGEELELIPIRGRRAPQRVPVAGIVDGFLGLVSYADLRWLNGVVGEASAVSSVQLQVRPDAAERRRLHRALKAVPAVQAINDHEQTAEKLRTYLLDALYFSIGALVGMAGVIFFGSIMTTSLIALAERSREVATLLVLGFELEQVGAIFLRESLIVNAIGGLLGLPIGLGLSIWVIETHVREAYRLPIVASPSSYVITLVFTVVFTLLAHLLVLRVMRRMDWLEALNAKE